jgi:hypothetical protein
MDRAAGGGWVRGALVDWDSTGGATEATFWVTLPPAKGMARVCSSSGGCAGDFAIMVAAVPTELPKISSVSMRNEGIETSSPGFAPGTEASTLMPGLEASEPNFAPGLERSPESTASSR